MKCTGLHDYQLRRIRVFMSTENDPLQGLLSYVALLGDDVVMADNASEFTGGNAYKVEIVDPFRDTGNLSDYPFIAHQVNHLINGNE